MIPRRGVTPLPAFCVENHLRHPAHCNALTQDPGSTPGMTNLVVAPAPFLVISAPAGIQAIRQRPRQPPRACDKVNPPKTQHLRPAGTMSPDVRYPFEHRFIPDYAHAPSGLRELRHRPRHLIAQCPPIPHFSSDNLPIKSEEEPIKPFDIQISRTRDKPRKRLISRRRVWASCRPRAIISRQ